MNKSRHKETIAHTKITLWLNFDAKDADAKAEEKLQAREEQEAAAAALARGQTAAGSSQAGDNKPNVAGKFEVENIEVDQKIWPFVALFTNLFCIYIEI